MVRRRARKGNRRTFRYNKGGAMRTYIYADESGNFDFSNGRGATRYFILASVAADEPTIAAIESDLARLRRELAWQGYSLPKGFHATNDKRYVRERLFSALDPYPFRIDATIFEKRKVTPTVYETDEKFYQFAWSAHLAGLMRELGQSFDDLLVTAASLDRKTREAFYSEIESANQKLPLGAIIKGDVVDAATNIMLQVADYCAWALQRKWERQPSDVHSYARINAKLATEFDLFGNSISYRQTN